MFIKRKLYLRFRCKLLYESYWRFIYIIYYLHFQTSHLKPNILHHCNNSHSMIKLQFAIKFFLTALSIHSYNYGVTYFWFTSFFILKTFFWREIASAVWQFNFFIIDIKSFYEPYLPFYIVFIISFLRNMI